MNRNEMMQREGYPRIAMSQRLRRMLQQVRNRSRWGVAAMQRWRSLYREGNADVEWYESRRDGR